MVGEGQVRLDLDLVVVLIGEQMHVRFLDAGLKPGSLGQACRPLISDVW
jgi:hypothetical protein